MSAFGRMFYRSLRVGSLVYLYVPIIVAESSAPCAPQNLWSVRHGEKGSSDVGRFSTPRGTATNVVSPEMGRAIVSPITAWYLFIQTELLYSGRVVPCCDCDADSTGLQRFKGLYNTDTDPPNCFPGQIWKQLTTDSTISCKMTLPLL